MIAAQKIAKMLDDGRPSEDPNKVVDPDPLVIVPYPNLKNMADSGSASVDLRLGTWFLTLRQARLTHLRVGEKSSESKLTKHHYVPFGEEYFLHPQSFVLGVTLEWVRLPSRVGAYVVGKSSLGRRGLIIATATGVHPGFTGCLTLELTNVGEIPIAIQPGMRICQLFFHEVTGNSCEKVDRSTMVGLRRPKLGDYDRDDVAMRLAQAYKITS